MARLSSFTDTPALASFLTLSPSGGGEREEQKSGGRTTRGGARLRADKSGREEGRTKDSSGDKPGESTISHFSALAGAADFVSALAGNCFSGHSLSAVAARGLSVERAARVALLPIAGRLQVCADIWRKITKSPWVLGVVTDGYKINWTDRTPRTPHRGRNPPTDEAGKVILDNEVTAMLLKGAIRVVDSSEDEVVSGFFARPKKTPGKFRPIVSLKYTNKYIVYQKFRMVTPAEIMGWIRPGYYFASIDLTDAYFSIALHNSAWRFTRFRWKDVTYEYMCVMFGLGPSARVFTKTLRAVLMFLREAFGIMLVAYIDDLLVQAADPVTCARHAEIAVLVLHCVGYGVNFAKSALVPSQTVEHLGFSWDSTSMMVSIPQAKVEKLVERVRELLGAGRATADELRSLLGTLESTRMVNVEAALHYRALQAQLPRRRQPFPGKLVIAFSRAARANLAWWANTYPSTQHTSTSLLVRPITLEVWTDASGLVGWGGHSSRGDHVQGRWEGAPAGWHINLKELEAARMSLDKVMAAGDVVSLHMDSMAAVAFCNRQGGTRSRLLCSSALALWDLVLSRKGWLRAHWLPREDNDQADFLSKYSLDAWDFGLKDTVAAGLWSRWFCPSMDLFGSSDFHQVGEYFSCTPDPRAAGADAFLATTWPDCSYAFPPAPLISKCLAKVQEQQCTVIMVVPRWTAAAWWDVLRTMTTEGPVTLGRANEVCRARQDRRLPRLGTMVACLVQGQVVAAVARR